VFGTGVVCATTIAVFVAVFVAVEFKVTVRIIADDLALGDVEVVDNSNVDVPSGRGAVLELDVIAVGNSTVVAERDPVGASASGAYDSVREFPFGRTGFDAVNIEFDFHFVLIVTAAVAFAVDDAKIRQVWPYTAVGTFDVVTMEVRIVDIKLE